MALEPCEYCGKEFEHDNAGARANHVESCRKQAEKYQQAQAQPAQQPQQAQPAPSATNPDPPAVRGEPQQPAPQPQQQAQQGGLPAAVANNAGEVGLAIGKEILAPASSNDPAESRVGKSRLAKTIFSAGYAWADEQERQAVEGQQRAQEMAGQEIQPAQGYPECAECGGLISDVPDSGEFYCPHCRALLEV